MRRTSPAAVACARPASPAHSSDGNSSASSSSASPPIGGGGGGSGRVAHADARHLLRERSPPTSPRGLALRTLLDHTRDRKRHYKARMTAFQTANERTKAQLQAQKATHEASLTVAREEREAWAARERELQAEVTRLKAALADSAASAAAAAAASGGTAATKHTPTPAKPLRRRSASPSAASSSSSPSCTPETSPIKPTASKKRTRDTRGTKAGIVTAPRKRKAAVRLAANDGCSRTQSETDEPAAKDLRAGRHYQGQDNQDDNDNDEDPSDQEMQEANHNNIHNSSSNPIKPGSPPLRPEDIINERIYAQEPPRYEPSPRFAPRAYMLQAGKPQPSPSMSMRAAALPPASQSSADRPLTIFQQKARGDDIFALYPKLVKGLQFDPEFLARTNIRVRFTLAQQIRRHYPDLITDEEFKRNSPHLWREELLNLPKESAIGKERTFYYTSATSGNLAKPRGNDVGGAVAPARTAAQTLLTTEKKAADTIPTATAPPPLAIHPTTPTLPTQASSDGDAGPTTPTASSTTSSSGGGGGSSSSIISKDFDEGLIAAFFQNHTTFSEDYDETSYDVTHAFIQRMLVDTGRLSSNQAEKSFRAVQIRISRFCNSEEHKATHGIPDYVRPYKGRSNGPQVRRVKGVQLN